MNEGYTATADYQHIDVALKSFWKPFLELVSEMDSFVPIPLSEFHEERKNWSESTRKLNPNMSEEEIRKNVEKRIESSGSASWQFFGKFSDRFMTMYVTVTLLAQALCEAEINAILAVGLHEKGLINQFAKIERADIRKKWLELPKLFCPQYKLDKDAELYKTLNHLIEERNTWMHHKIDLCVGEEKILAGSIQKRNSYQETIQCMKRYFSLPYDLASHALTHTQLPIATIMVFTRNPIPIAEAHN